MFRDRLRRWRINDKNRRSAANQRRGVLQLVDNGDKISSPGPHCSTIGRSSSRSATLDHENIHNVLRTPKEMLALQRTLKGILDWHQHAEDTTVDLDHGWTFFELLKEMYQCLVVSDESPFTCEKVTPHLRKTSAALQSHMIICTPLAILISVELLSYFAFRSNSSPWYHETSRFLINAAVQAFPDSHPSILLLRLLFSNLTSSQLVMLYEVGSNVMDQRYGGATTFFFRVRMLSVASTTGLGVAIRSYADALCTATPEETDDFHLLGIARVYRLTGQYEESAEAVRRCLAQTEDEGNGHSVASLEALHFLASLQNAQNDFVGEEITLQKLLTTVLAKDRREIHTSGLSISALRAISMLDGFYARLNLDEQRDALQLEFPSAFEL
jgi:hypothetical protein